MHEIARSLRSLQYCMDKQIGVAFLGAFLWLFSRDRRKIVRARDLGRISEAQMGFLQFIALPTWKEVLRLDKVMRRKAIMSLRITIKYRKTESAVLFSGAFVRAFLHFSRLFSLFSVFF